MALFENLTAELLKNPIFWAFVLGFIRNILGYLENIARDRTEKYDASKLAETELKWIAMMIFISQWLPVEAAAGLSFVVDIFTSGIKTLKQTKT